MLHCTWWLLTLARNGRLYRALHSKIIGYMQSLHAWLPEITPYMWCIHGRTVAMNMYLFNCIWTSGKEARSLFAAQYWYRSCLWMSLSSMSSVSNTIPRCLYRSTDFTFWPPSVSNVVTAHFALLALKRHTNSLAATENNSMRLCIILTHIMYTLQPSYTCAKHTNVIRKHQII